MDTVKLEFLVQAFYIMNRLLEDLLYDAIVFQQKQCVVTQTTIMDCIPNYILKDIKHQMFAELLKQVDWISLLCRLRGFEQSF
jgi:hypothetical protein